MTSLDSVLDRSAALHERFKRRSPLPSISAARQALSALPGDRLSASPRTRQATTQGAPPFALAASQLHRWQGRDVQASHIRREGGEHTTLERAVPGRSGGKEGC